MTPLSGIITNGLGLPACSLTYRFHLFALVEAVVIRQEAGGGPYPGPAWNKIGHDGLPHGRIQDFYKPTDPAFYMPTSGKRDRVILKITLGEKVTEKEFLVKPIYTNFIVNIVNFTNKTFGVITGHAINFKILFGKALNFMRRNYK